MLNGDAIQKIVDLSKYEIIDSEGSKFHLNSKGYTRICYPDVQTFKCFSLTQLMNFLEVIQPLYKGKLCINVENYNKVDVVIPILNKNKKWDFVATADFSNMIEDFPFERKMDQEDFIINLMTKFASSEELTNLLALVSSIKDERLKTSNDDGFSQVAATKTGVHLASEAKIKNLWKLKTFKTFPEMEQPDINYILRLHQRSEETPKFAMYDCDGGQWRVKTTIAIKKWNEKHLTSNESGMLEKVVVL